VVGDLASTADDAGAKTCVKSRLPPSDLVCEAGVRLPRWDPSDGRGLPEATQEQEEHFSVTTASALRGVWIGQC